jgi:hypothetical protein
MAEGRSQMGLHQRRPNAEFRQQVSAHRLDSLENCIEVGEISGFKLRVKCLAIHDDLKCATGRRHQAERSNILFKSQEFLRQTDGFRFVISNAAIFDDDLYAHRQSLRKQCISTFYSALAPGSKAVYVDARPPRLTNIFNHLR